MFAKPSVVPTSSASASGRASRASALTIGIEPPLPASMTSSAPGGRPRGAGGVVGRSPGSSRRRSRCPSARAWTVELDAERAEPAPQVLHHGRLRLHGVLLGVDADVELGARVRRDGVDRAVDARRVDPDHGDRRAGPHARPEVPRADERHAVEDRPGELPESSSGCARPGPPRVAGQPRDRDVALVVVQRGDRPDDREQGVGRRATVLAAVLRGRERPRLDR